MSNTHPNSYFVAVVGNDVAVRIVIPSDGGDATDRMIAALASNPTIIQTTDINHDIDFGWTYDGTNFNPPA
jgi:hypothetical protein